MSHSAVFSQRSVVSFRSTLLHDAVSLLFSLSFHQSALLQYPCSVVYLRYSDPLFAMIGLIDSVSSSNSQAMNYQDRLDGDQKHGQDESICVFADKRFNH